MSLTTSFAPEASAGFHRHAFVRLRPGAVIRPGEASSGGAIREWVDRGRPAIIRRPGLSPDGARLSVGIALPPEPPHGRKERLGFEVDVPDICEIFLPPLWADCPGADHPVVRQIESAIGAVRLFGSHAWQFLTGLPYVTAASDLDLVVFLDSAESWREARAGLVRIPLPPGLDLEVVLARDASFSWREYAGSPESLLFKGNSRVWKGRTSDIESLLAPRHAGSGHPPDDSAIARAVSRALRAELAAYPKPGLVSHVDSGSHPDVDASDFLASINAIEPFFAALARAGAGGAGLPRLQQIGLAAEQAMLRATGGRNTHRGAIFSLGLLAAAAGCRAGADVPLGDIVRERWGAGILLPSDLPGGSDGVEMGRIHGVGGARREARDGFPSVYRIGLPALRGMNRHHPGAMVQVFFELLACCEDTTLLKRGGEEGWQFAKEQAGWFLARGGVRAPDWHGVAEEIHRNFVARNLTAGGVADLLAATCFVREMEDGP